MDPLTPHSDLNGLAVHDADDLLTGHVHGVLSEAETGILRFLDVEIDGRQRHVLVPVGHARLEDSVTGPRIRLRAARLEDLSAVPPHSPGPELPDAGTARELLAAHGRFFRGDRYYSHPAFDHRGLYAGEHPIVAVSSPRELLDDQLIRLGQCDDYRVAHGEPDVRGWQQLDAERARAGEVVDLIADVEAMKVRYVVVRDDGGKERILPIGYVELEPENSALFAPGLTQRDITTLPEFIGLPLNRLEEERLTAQIDELLDARNPFLRPDFSNRQVSPEPRRVTPD